MFAQKLFKENMDVLLIILLDQAGEIYLPHWPLKRGWRRGYYITYIIYLFTLFYEVDRNIITCPLISTSADEQIFETNLGIKNCM